MPTDRLSAAEYRRLYGGQLVAQEDKRKLVQREAELQRAVVEYLSLQRDLIVFAVPNGGSRNRIEAARMNRQGVRAGVADLVVMLLGGVVGFIELKAEKGKLSAAQKWFRAACEILGHPWALCRSVDEVAAVIADWRKR